MKIFCDFDKNRQAEFCICSFNMAHMSYRYSNGFCELLLRYSKAFSVGSDAFTNFIITNVCHMITYAVHYFLFFLLLFLNYIGDCDIIK